MPDTAKPGDSFRSVFRTAEDPLTAAVFSRLAYLDPVLLWDILRSATRFELPTGTRPIRLTEAQFWPGWSLTTVDGSRSVEPDVFMRFDIGDPPRRIDLVVECKRGDGHDSRQWDREWRAHSETYPDEDPDRDVVLLAVGRWGKAPPMEISTIQTAHQGPMPEGFRAVAMDWCDLTDALARLTVDDRDRRIVDDILDALGLHGHLNVREMRGLPRYQIAFERSHQALADRSLQAPEEALQERAPRLDPLAGWLARIVTMRSGPASHDALRRM
ncbi:hypothetical protein [Methylobacterium sp. J-092]|uniref:hypothetical protein n=1 Tax=Methylobacterium sp. J-092 TaxID=2836667 RepID=UPI001FBA50B0|nr:hypothetical protein [Methylobacterium sp. J-092]MCJ2006255.1 hypothetical protein [Methylobacterium sp. J-092]